MQINNHIFSYSSVQTSISPMFCVWDFVVSDYGYLLIVSLLNLIIGIELGGLAITVANPTDLVKVRLQAEGKLPLGVPRRYLGAVDAYIKIIKQVHAFALE